MANRRAKRLLAIFVAGFLLISLATTVIYRVPDGHSGVYYARVSGGTQLGVSYPAGWQAKFPWDMVYFYDHRDQHVTDRFKVLTNQGETVSIDAELKFRLRKEAVPLVHKLIGPEYIERVVKPSIAEHLSGLAGNLSKSQLLAMGETQLGKRALDLARADRMMTLNSDSIEGRREQWLVLQTLKITISPESN